MLLNYEKSYSAFCSGSGMTPSCSSMKAYSAFFTSFIHLGIFGALPRMCCLEASAGMATRTVLPAALALDQTTLELVWLAEAVKSAMQERPSRLMSSFLRSKVTSGAASFWASALPSRFFRLGVATKKDLPSAVFCVASA